MPEIGSLKTPKFYIPLPHAEKKKKRYQSISENYLEIQTHFACADPAVILECN